jgi:hypothetical protein
MCFTEQFNHLAAIDNQALGLHGFNPCATVTPSNVRQWDILCGKSKRCVDHDGSRRFRTVIECHRERYEQALTKVRLKPDAAKQSSSCSDRVCMVL